MKEISGVTFEESFQDLFFCLSGIVLRICNAPVIYISGAPRVGDSRDIAGLKCRDFTSDESRQCLFSPPWNRRVKIIQIA